MPKINLTKIKFNYINNIKKTNTLLSGLATYINSFYEESKPNE